MQTLVIDFVEYVTLRVSGLRVLPSGGDGGPHRPKFSEFLPTKSQFTLPQNLISPTQNFGCPMIYDMPILKKCQFRAKICLIINELFTNYGNKSLDVYLE